MYTAAEAQCAFIADHIEPGSKIFVISGGGDFWKARPYPSPNPSPNPSPLTLTLARDP